MDRPSLAGQFRFVREFGGELIILDDQHDVAHRLDAEAAAVWRACDGGTRSTAAAIAERTGLEAPRVRELLTGLEERGLLAGGGDTRRTMLRKAALTGAALAAVPAITSVLVPGPAQAFNSQPVAQQSSSGPPQGGEPLVSSSSSSGAPAGGTGPAVEGSSVPVAPSASRRPGRHGARPGHGRRPSRPAVAGARQSRPLGGGAAGGAPDVAAAAGGGRPVPRGTLPFTGSNLVAMAATGTGMIVAGAAARAAAGPAEPAP